MQKAILSFLYFLVTFNYSYAGGSHYPYHTAKQCVQYNSSGKLLTDGDTVMIQAIVVAGLSGPGAYDAVSCMDSTGYVVINYKPSNCRLGDSVLVKGRMSQTPKPFGSFNDSGMAYMRVDSFTITSRNHPIPKPRKINQMDYTMEGQVVVFDSVYADTTSWYKPPYTLVTFYQPHHQYHTFKIHPCNQTIYKPYAHTGYYNVTGVVMRNSSTLSLSKGLRLETWHDSNFKVTNKIDSSVMSKIHSINQFYYNTSKPNEPNNYKAKSAGAWVKIKGVVQSPNFLYGKLLFAVSDSTGSICVYHNITNYGFSPAIGDSILVRGRILQLDPYISSDLYSGLTFIYPDSFHVISSGNKQIKPIPLKSRNKNVEGQLVELKNVKLLAGWDTSTHSQLMTAVFTPDGKRDYGMKISDQINLYTEPAPVTRVNIRGILIPYFISDYQDSIHYYIYACSKSDVFPYTQIDETEISAKRINLFPNPATLELYFGVEGLGKFEYKIQDFTGKTIQAGEGNGLSHLDIHDMPAGLYVVKAFFDNSAIVTRKFIKL